MKKIYRYGPTLLGGILVITIIYALITYPPIMAGMASKTMCSCVYVMGRTPESVIQKELTVFPGLGRARFEIKDSSSVTATFLWSTRKSIYRKGLGCTLLAERTEEEVRRQQPALPHPPALNQDTIAWPAGNLTSNSRVAGVDYQKVEGALQEAFDEPNPGRPKNTLAIIILFDGQIVGERYADGFNYNSPMMGWSMTKGLTNGLVGLLVREGKLAVNATPPMPEWEGDERKNITLNDLMHASSGLEWSELYSFPGDFHTMFMDRDDKGGYAASKALEYEPDERFEYSSGTSNLISKIVRRTVGEDQYPRFAYERLFYKIGMYHTLVETDASGTFVGSSLGYASARDWARFGLLFSNDGLWNGERILPEGWVEYSSTPASAAPIGQYGAQWWLNAGAKDHPEKSYHPGLPRDEYGAEGFEGQYIFIVPSKKLVVVRLGISHDGFDMTRLVQKVISALPDKPQP